MMHLNWMKRMKEKSRTCDGCTKCCEGWLWGQAYNHKFWTGRPCHFMSKKGCSIYEKRPDEPCKSFQCEWLKNEDIPEWMKPDQINAIIYMRQENDKTYLEITEAGSKLDSRVLSWFVIEFANKKIKNLKYQVDGGWNFLHNE